MQVIEWKQNSLGPAGQWKSSITPPNSRMEQIAKRKIYSLDANWHTKFAGVSRYMIWSSTIRKFKLLFRELVSFNTARDTFSFNPKTYLSWEEYQNHFT